MLDCVGLLSRGNEEMFRFAWKAFSRWQSRSTEKPEGNKTKTDLYEFMKGFRETFGRPVRRIRFLGLFDTVNSVPRFESKWMSRSKFPYVSTSSALTIRHAVSIDERRAKFRQNLIGQQRPQQHDYGVHHIHDALHTSSAASASEKPEVRQSLRLSVSRHSHLRFKPHKNRRQQRMIASSAASVSSLTGACEAWKREPREADDDADEAKPQDVQEIWFPGECPSCWQLVISNILS